MARAYQRGQKVWSPYGEQNTERSLRFGQESEREAAQRQYDANVAYGMGLQKEAGQRSQFATSTLADLQSRRLNAAMGVASSTPTTTSGYGRGLGQIGAAAMYADANRTPTPNPKSDPANTTSTASATGAAPRPNSLTSPDWTSQFTPQIPSAASYVPFSPAARFDAGVENLQRSSVQPSTSIATRRTPDDYAPYSPRARSTTDFSRLAMSF